MGNILLSIVIFFVIPSLLFIIYKKKKKAMLRKKYIFISQDDRMSGLTESINRKLKTKPRLLKEAVLYGSYHGPRSTGACQIGIITSDTSVQKEEDNE